MFATAIEKSLSAKLFVFVVVVNYTGVEPRTSTAAPFWGILGAAPLGSPRGPAPLLE